MATDLIQFDSENPSKEVIDKAASAIRLGKVIAVPTDVLYALVADPVNLHAVTRVFSAKGREMQRSLPLLVSDLLMAEELAADVGLLFVNPGCLEFAGGNIQSDPAPGRGRQLGDLFEHGRGSSSKGDEGNPHLIQSCQVCQGGQTGIENQMGGRLAMGLLPKGNEAKDLLRFFSLSNIGVGIAKGTPIGIVGKKDQDAGLSPASGRDIVAFHHGMLPIVRDGMEIQVKGVAGQKAVTLELLVPEGKEAKGCFALDAAGVL